jgi:predicted  nucleic acid-binding Zn-ribbon protein
MSISPHRASIDPQPYEHEEVPVAQGEQNQAEPRFDRMSWAETRDINDVASEGARQVLGWALSIMALLWTGYTAWSAGRSLADQPLSSPAVAQWVAILAGPLALMGLVWLMFGRTRRKEAERFTRSVVAMRTEARSLQDLLAALSQQIEDNHRTLGQMAGDLMGLGDQAATRLSAITAGLTAGSQTLAEHGAALDRAAEAARTDIGVLLGDLPQAEDSARRMAEMLRAAGRTAIEQAAGFETQVGQLAAQAQQADAVVHEASQRLLSQLTHIESAGAAAALRVSDAGSESGAIVDALLVKAADALNQIQVGIDTQASAVSALVAQSQAGIGRAGIDASELLGERLASAGNALDGLTSRIAEQERASQRLMADLDAGLSALDDRFLDLARSGDERANHVQTALARLRAELEALSGTTAGQDTTLDGLAERTARLRQGLDQLSQTLQGEMSVTLTEAEAGAARLLASAEAARPQVVGMRDAAIEAADRIEAGASNVDAQQERLAGLMTSVDLGVSRAEQRLAELSAAIATAGEEANRLSAETGPALVASLVQVREAAAHAAERAREVIGKIIPESASELGEATRAALEAAVREGVESKLVELDLVATRAVETAREASDRLTAQMLSIGQSAAALEAHIERNREAQRKDSGEEFARRVSLLMDSMHSASIDVQKILSDEIDDKAWNHYLKGNRGVFTRRAVRLLGGTESRAIAAQYESDPEFQTAVNHYVHDFESMLRRVLAERDGGMIAVTLMSSDMGKLYAALAQAVEKRR